MLHIPKKTTLGIVLVLAVGALGAGMFSQLRPERAAAANNITVTLSYESPATIKVNYKGTATDKEGRSFDVDGSDVYKDSDITDDTYQYTGGCSGDGKVKMSSLGATTTTGVTVSFSSKFNAGECVKVNYSKLNIGNPDGAAIGSWTSPTTITITGMGEKGTDSVVLAKEGGTNVFSATSNKITYKLTMDPSNKKGDLYIKIQPINDGPTIKGVTILGSPSSPVKPPSNDSGAGGGADQGSTKPECGTSSTALTWIICPIFNVVQSAGDTLNNAVTSLLEIKSNEIFGDNETGNAYHSAWSDMRNIALIIIVITALIMIIAQAVGSQAVDAYTIKSVMPRLLIAAIFIALSWIILQFFVDLTNVLGEGVRSLIYAPFSGLNSSVHPAGTDGPAGSLLGGVETVTAMTGAILLAVSGGVLLSFGMALLLGLIIGFLVVVLRQVMITFLIIVAPIAIACYVLPNTKKVFSTWWDWFLKGLMMFPIIVGFIAAGRVFALVSFSQAKGGESILFAMVGIIAYIIPFFMLPFTFKMAGGAIGGMAQGLHGALAKPRAMLRKRGLRQMGKTFGETRTGNRWHGGTDDNLRGRLNRVGARAANLDKLSWNPRQWRSDVRTGVASHASTEVENALKDPEYANEWGGDDDLNRAASESHDAASLRAALMRADERRVARGEAARFTDPGDMRDAVALVERQRKKMSTNAFRQLTTQQSLAGGTAYNDYVDSAGNFHSGAGEAWAAVAAAGNGDSAATARLVKNGRQVLMQAGKVDQGGAGFGATIGAVRSIQDAMNQGVTGQALQDVINNAGTAVEDSAIDSSPAGQAVYGKPTSARVLARAHRRKIDNIMASIASGQAVNVNGENRVATERDLKQAMASAAGVYDAMSQAAPQNAREFADGLTGVGLVVSNLPPNLRASLSPGGGNLSMIDAFDNMRGVDPDFAQMRRDFATQTAQQAAAAAAAQPGAAGPPQAGPPGGPGAGIPSDFRLKRNVKHLGTTVDGVKIYSFQYNWSNQFYVGVMAQDLTETHPEAISIDKNGYYYVDYSQLGLRMQTLEEWQTTHNRTDI